MPMGCIYVGRHNFMLKFRKYRLNKLTDDECPLTVGMLGALDPTFHIQLASSDLRNKLI